MSNLDRLVAEKVTGAKPHVSLEVSNDGGKSSAFGSDDFTTRGDVHNWLREKQAGGMMLDYKVVEWKHYQRYHDRIDVAWEVVEHLRGRGWTFTISDNDNPKTRLFYCSFIGIDGHLPPRGWAHDSRPCIAICLAALRAVGVSEAEIQEAMQ